MLCRMFLREALHFFKGSLRAVVVQKGDHRCNADCADQKEKECDDDQITARPPESREQFATESALP